jgi:hypothetical protein
VGFWLGMVFMAVTLAISLPDQSLKNRGAKRLYWFLPLTIIGLIGVILSYSIFQWIQKPPQWDFFIFWFDGRLAAHGLNFYDPNTCKTALGNMPIAEDVRLELLNGGFRYPPPTMFLFVILGWFELRTAAFLWYLVSVIFLIGSSILIWKRYFLDAGILGFSLALAFLLLLRSSYSTLSFGQTNVIVLFLFLLGLRNTSSKSVGIWWGLASIVKPFMVVLVVPFIVQRKWKALLVFVSLWGGLLVLACLAFGFETCLNYFTSNQLSRMPSSYYTELANQSLLATMMRITHGNSLHGSPLNNILFLAIGASLCIVSFLVILKANTAAYDASVIIVLLCGLMIYPGTLSHYALLLIVVLFELLRFVARFRLGHWAGIGVVIFIYAFPNLQYGEFVFWGLLSAWLAILFFIIADNRKNIFGIV